MLNGKRIRDLQSGIPMDKFPATLQDAVTFTRGLKIKYLWIDALCVKQDSPTDWQKKPPK